MSQQPISQKQIPGKISQFIWASLLSVAAVILVVVCIVILRLSPEFADNTKQIERPIIKTFIWFTIAFFVYLGAIFASLKITKVKAVLWISIFVAILLRLILLVSYPFQEVDAYRYIWDGNVVANGMSPYRHSPLAARKANGNSGDESLDRLAELRRGDPGLNTILHRVHFAELPTVYPPVSQAVFAASAKTTPWVATMRGESKPSLESHLFSMKGWIVLFDLAILGLLCHLLTIIKLRPGWSIAYGWSPLVLKEFANTGHLDAIAIFFLVLAVYLCVRFIFINGRDAKSRLHPFWIAIIVGFVLALGVGSKLFPIVVTPLLFVVFWRKTKIRHAFVFGLAAIVFSGLVLFPWLGASSSNDVEEQSQALATDPGDGLAAFLTRWRINDFLFMIVQENIERPEVYKNSSPPWFVVVPPETRDAIINSSHRVGNRVLAPLAKRLKGDEEQSEIFALQQTSFLLTRFLTLSLFTFVAIWIAFSRKWMQGEEMFLLAVFLTLACFWFTLPTQNPWYWCWAMPFVCFAKNRWWLVLSGFVFIYYLRFFFRYHGGGVDLFGTSYRGMLFFDFVVTWIEYFPFLIVLGASWIIRIWSAALKKKLPPVAGA